MSLVRWAPFGDVDRLFNPLMPSAFENSHGGDLVPT